MGSTCVSDDFCSMPAWVKKMQRHVWQPAPYWNVIPAITNCGIA
jgi:hypothetical protein